MAINGHGSILLDSWFSILTSDRSSTFGLIYRFHLYFIYAICDFKNKCFILSSIIRFTRTERFSFLLLIEDYAQCTCNLYDSEFWSFTPMKLVWYRLQHMQLHRITFSTSYPFQEHAKYFENCNIFHRCLHFEEIVTCSDETTWPAAITEFNWKWFTVIITIHFYEFLPYLARRNTLHLSEFMLAAGLSISS